MHTFSLQTRLYSGPGSLAALQRFSHQHIWIVCDGFLARSPLLDRLRAALPASNRVSVFSDITPDPTIHTVAKGIAQMQTLRPQVVIGFGGGSAMDAAKAIVWFSQQGGLPVDTCVAIPTTSGTGSEVTSACVISDPEKGIKYRHTWNIVKIGGTYYHLDATFDNTLGKHSAAGQEIRYDYFNLDDKKIFRDHEPLIAPAPVCTNGDHFYYREKKLSFTKEEDVYKRSLQAAKKGRTLTFQWRGGYLTREVLEKLLDLLRKAGEEKQKAARISLNWSQAVIRVSYVEDRGLACVDMEEANEGEKE